VIFQVLYSVVIKLQASTLKKEKDKLSDQLARALDDIDREQRDNDELRFDYERTSKEVCILIYYFILV
jgi:uncharacterized FlaG/YvyC family protein